MPTESIKKPYNLQAQFKMRTCMNDNCGKKFLSESFGNRLCNTCRHRRSEIEEHRVYI